MIVNEQELANDGLTLEDLVPAPPTIDTERLLETTQKTFEMFKECRQYDLPKNPFFKPQILVIKENETKFQKATKESIKQSDDLTEYAADLVQFAEFCIDPTNTADDLLEGTRAILKRAKSNNQKTSEILHEYLTIVNGLVYVRADVEDHRADIIEAENLIKRKEQESSEEENKIEAATKNKERRSNWIKGGALVAGVGGTIALAVAIPAIAGAIIAEEIVALAVFGTSAFASGSVTAFVQGLYAGKDGKQIKLSKKKIEKLKKEMEGLKEMVEGSIETVDKLTKNLKQIIELVTVFESFWQSQVGNLERLVEAMETSSDAEEQPTTTESESDSDDPAVKPVSKFVALSIKSKWKGVEKEHRLYTEALKRITVKNQIE